MKSAGEAKRANRHLSHDQALVARVWGWVTTEAHMNWPPLKRRKHNHKTGGDRLIGINQGGPQRIKLSAK